MNDESAPPSPAIQVLFTPTEFAGLAGQDLSRTVCVVFDVLRATSTALTALANGASGIVPVAEIQEALAWRERVPDVLLAGERNGVRITGGIALGTEFDLGNSPTEFTPEKVQGKMIVMTTTNGTRALRACAHAKRIWLGSFLNLGALATVLRREPPTALLVVCSGTYEEASFEDTLGAGALCDRLWPDYFGQRVSDSAQVAREVYQRWKNDLIGAMALARNGRRLLEHPELSGDVAFFLQEDRFNLVAALCVDGVVRRQG